MQVLRAYSPGASERMSGWPWGLYFPFPIPNGMACQLWGYGGICPRGPLRLRGFVMVLVSFGDGE